MFQLAIIEHYIMCVYELRLGDTIALSIDYIYIFIKLLRSFFFILLTKTLIYGHKITFINNANESKVLKGFYPSQEVFSTYKCFEWNTLRYSSNYNLFMSEYGIQYFNAQIFNLPKMVLQ